MTKGQKKAYRDSLERRSTYFDYESVEAYLNDDIQDYVVVFETKGALSGGVGIGFYEDADEAYETARALNGKAMMVRDWVKEAEIF